jgi:hypothetical protein
MVSRDTTASRDGAFPAPTVAMSARGAQPIDRSPVRRAWGLCRDQGSTPMARRLSPAGISASSALERDRSRLGSKSAPDKQWPATSGTSTGEFLRLTAGCDIAAWGFGLSEGTVALRHPASSAPQISAKKLRTGDEAPISPAHREQ